MNEITIYHGSELYIKEPKLRLGKINNDYGQGFYCTQDIELAREWACKNNYPGFLNTYKLDLNGLKILNLKDENYSVLNWIALLLKNREFSMKYEIGIEAREYIIDNFYIDTSEYDLIIGYRADDSYFSYAQSFVNNSLPLRLLNKALFLGNLGIQIVLKTEKAFKHLEFIGYESVDNKVYYKRFTNRDLNARKEYKEEIKNEKRIKEDIFVIDILRGDE